MDAGETRKTSTYIRKTIPFSKTVKQKEKHWIKKPRTFDRVTYRMLDLDGSIGAKRRPIGRSLMRHIPSSFLNWYRSSSSLILYIYWLQAPWFSKAGRIRFTRLYIYQEISRRSICAAVVWRWLIGSLLDLLSYGKTREHLLKKKKRKKDNGHDLGGSRSNNGSMASRE